MGTGSEVAHCLAANDELATQGIATRVVALPCWRCFDEQPLDYRDVVLRRDVPSVSLEAGATLGLDQVRGRRARHRRLRHVGAGDRTSSNYFNINPAALVAHVRRTFWETHDDDDWTNALRRLRTESLDRQHPTRLAQRRDVGRTRREGRARRDVEPVDLRQGASRRRRPTTTCLAGRDVDDPEALFETLAVQDVRDACDVLGDGARGVASEFARGDRRYCDGFVSLEVSPRLARDTDGTVAAAKRLCGRGRPPERDDQDSRHPRGSARRSPRCSVRASTST